MCHCVACSTRLLYITTLCSVVGTRIIKLDHCVVSSYKAHANLFVLFIPYCLSSLVVLLMMSIAALHFSSFNKRNRSGAALCDGCIIVYLV
jgi:hypothetical protein